MSFAQAAQIATLIAAIAALVAALVGVCGVRISLGNSRKIDAVKHNTDGLAHLAVSKAQELGVAEGKAAEKANPTT
jgi:hypothetical protein